MDVSPDLSLRDREFVPFRIVFYQVVELSFSSPFRFPRLPELEEENLRHFVDEGHFLRAVERAVDFSEIERLCVAGAPDRKGGHPPIPPLKLYKLYLVRFLFHVSGVREWCRRAKADFVPPRPETSGRPRGRAFYAGRSRPWS